MVMSWTRGRVFRRSRKGKDTILQVNDLEVEVSIPSHFRCPVTLELMRDPVTVCTGITYDRESIEKWIEEGNTTCPVTKRDLTTFDTIPNHAIRRMIQDWCVENRSLGIERIPTPRIPVTPYEVSDTCTKIISASQTRDVAKCVDLVKKIKNWGKESERNKRCIAGNGAPLALANTFATFSSPSPEGDESNGNNNVVGMLLEEILGVMTWMRPIGQDARTVLSSERTTSCMVWLLSNGNDLTTRQSVAWLLKEIPMESLERSQGVVEGLVEAMKDPIGKTHAPTTKACLSTIFQLVNHWKSNREWMVSRLVELGLVEILLEILVDADRGACEKALGVLNCVCGYESGREAAKANALTLPVVIKKLLRVSELSSSFAVSIVWKLCGEREERVLVEALQVGVFQKLLVLLQVGCGEGTTKERATELLKVLNGYRNKAQCVDSSSLELNHLNKPF